MHMSFTIKGREGLGRKLWQKCHELCWILPNCSTNTRHTRVSFPSLMDNMQPMTTHKPGNRNGPNKYSHAPARFSICDKNKMPHMISRKTCIPQASRWQVPGTWKGWGSSLYLTCPSLGLGIYRSQSLTGLFKKWCFRILICPSFSFCHISLLIENWQQKCLQPQISRRTWRHSNRLKYFDFYEF